MLKNRNSVTRTNHPGYVLICHLLFLTCKFSMTYALGAPHSQARNNRIRVANKELPQDVMERILLRLPVKSLMRFKCLSKTFRSLITNRRFIEKHFKLSADRPGVLIFHYKSGFFASFFSNEISDPAVSLRLPRLSNKIVSDITQYGPCNGIFCLHVTYSDRMSQLCLWNPATREVKVLPPPHHPNLLAGEFFVHGLGIVSKTNDYKVISILATMNLDIQSRKPCSAEIYNLSTNSWRIIDFTESAFSLVSPSFDSYLKGVYHWLTLGLQNDGIICFDMNTNAFWKIELPPFSEDYSVQQVIDCNIAVVNDTIALIKEYSINYGMNSRIEIWIMNEYGVAASWSKRYIIGPNIRLPRFWGFWKDEILAGYYNHPLVLYDLDARQELREFRICVRPLLFQAFRYVASMFPLSVPNAEAA